MEEDTDYMWQFIQDIVAEYSLPQLLDEHISRDHAREMVRYGGSELHNISALIGGVAAQEAVKIVTHQYMPLNNTYIYNGIVGCGETYAL